MQHKGLQHTRATTANGSSSDARKLLEDFHYYKGIILRGWRIVLVAILVTLTAAAIYIAGSKTTYRASSRLLIIQQNGNPVHVAGANSAMDSDGRAAENLATHMLLLKSPVIIEQALKLSGVTSVGVGSVILNLTVKQPDPAANVVDLGYKTDSADQAQRILDGLIESYKLFLKSNYQKNSSDVISLITNARNDLNAELKALEQAYLEYRQKNPAYSADASNRTFVSRRLDQWDQALNQLSARSLQLQSLVERGKKMSLDGVDPASIATALSQVAPIGANVSTGSTASPIAATNSTPNDETYLGIVQELAQVESRRKMAELYLEHYQRENHESADINDVTNREIEQRFLADPDVAEVVTAFRRATQQLAYLKRVSRNAADPAVIQGKKAVDILQEEYNLLWQTKRPMIAARVASDTHPDLASGYHAAEAQVIQLKARENALRDRLDQVATDEIEKLRQHRDQLVRQHGESHPLVAQVKQRIASIEGHRDQSSNAPGGRNSNALIDYMSQSLEVIEAMRNDLQKKFDEDLALSKKAEITLLEESNLRSNLERQRALFNSVVDQLKQARLASDFDSVSTQMIAPITVAADQTKTIQLLLMAVIAGFALGSGVAFVADLIDARVRTVAEIREIVQVPLIGVIPLIRDDGVVTSGMAGLLSHQKPRSALAESYKTTRTNLEFLRRGRNAHVLLVASSLPGDGKTTTVTNLAISLASTGRRVLLIDGDLRKPSLHKMFDVECEGGLSDALTSHHRLELLVRPTFVENLDLLTTGRFVSNPAELLASERLGEILTEFRTSYDMILIDSSPLLLVTDPTIIAAVADGVIWVVRLASTRRHDLEVTHEMLGTLGVPIFGMLVNGVTANEAGYGYSAYGYGKYGKQFSPYGVSEEPTANGNGSLPHNWKLSLGAKGTLENGTHDAGPV